MPLNYRTSYWEYQNFFADLDLLIVGGGLTGLQSAIRLKERRPKLRLVVVDRGPLPIGASTRNAGFACFGSLTELLADLREMPEDDVWQTVDRRFRGLELLKRRFPTDAIRYHQWGGYELFEDEEEEIFERCVEQMAYFNQRTATITGHREVFRVVDDRIADFGLHSIRHMIRNELEGQLDPGALMRHLLQRAAALDIPMLTGVEVRSYNEGPSTVQLQTSLPRTIEARRVLLATNAFTDGLVAAVPIEPARNQVLITEPLDGVAIKGCFHHHQGYIYWRNVGNRLLIGGGRHLDLTGEATADFGAHPVIRSFLHDKLATWTGRKAAELPVAFEWSGIIAQGPKKTPIVRPLSDRIFLAVRLAGMGVALSSLLAEEASDLILGEG